MKRKWHFTSVENLGSILQIVLKELIFPYDFWDAFTVVEITYIYKHIHIIINQ